MSKKHIHVETINKILIIKTISNICLLASLLSTILLTLNINYTTNELKITNNAFCISAASVITIIYLNSLLLSTLQNKLDKVNNIKWKYFTINAKQYKKRLFNQGRLQIEVPSDLNIHIKHK